MKKLNITKGQFNESYQDALEMALAESIKDALTNRYGKMYSIRWGDESWHELIVQDTACNKVFTVKVDLTEH